MLYFGQKIRKCLPRIAIPFAQNFDVFAREIGVLAVIKLPRSREWARPL
jgi:hypothetical protein